MKHAEPRTGLSYLWRRFCERFGAMGLASVIVLLLSHPCSAREEPRRFTLPETDQPRLLLPDEVKAGLAIRVQQMRERHRLRALPQDALPSFDSETKPPIGVDTPLPPDEVGGEIDLERQQMETP